MLLTKLSDFETMLARADVGFDGARPWDMRVRNSRLYRRLLTQWSLGAGEAYVEGDWDCDRLDMLFERLLRAELDRTAPAIARLQLLAESLRQRLFNRQSVARAHQVGERHYDVGNDVFEAMLDSRMIYSCAYWAQAQDLEQAQAHKLDMICRKLELQPGETLLEALSRELMEEGRIEMTAPPALHAIYFHPLYSIRDHVALYVVRDFRQTELPKANHEIAAHGFFPVDALPSDTTKGTRARIDEVLRGAAVPERW